MIKVANIQHLATPIHAQLAESRSALELAGHAPPDARGRPRARAASAGEALIAELEGSTAAGTRARSAGWTPPRTASSASPCARRCCATAPPTSSPAPASSPTPIPAAELAETEIKLAALLPLLAG